MGASEARVLRTLRAVLLALHVATVHTVREGHIPAAAHLQQHPEDGEHENQMMFSFCFGDGFYFGRKRK